MEFNGGEGRSGREAAMRPAARPWRGAGAGAGAAGVPAPPKVYRVEPRDFRELVQRLTGAGAAPPAAAGPAMGVRQAAPAHATAAAGHGRREATAVDVEQFDYAPWFSAPLLSPASMPADFDGHHGNSALL